VDHAFVAPRVWRTAPIIGAVLFLTGIAPSWVAVAVAAASVIQLTAGADAGRYSAARQLGSMGLGVLAAVCVELLSVVTALLPFLIVLTIVGWAGASLVRPKED
jgi:hypothetical protein